MCPRSKKYKPCYCGCGEMVRIGKTSHGDDRQYVQGHNRVNKKHTKVSRLLLSIKHTGKVLSEDHRKAIGRGNKGLPKWNRGMTLKEMYGSERAKEILDKMSKGNKGKVRTVAMRRNYSKGRSEYLATARPENLTNTSIEKALKKELWHRGIPFRSQAKIGSFTVDIKLVGVPIAIECDGDYWHSLPKTIAKDAIRNKVVPQKLNGSLLIFTGSEIRNNIRRCGRIVERAYNEFRS